MIESLQIEEIAIIEIHDSPKLLVEWSSRWDEFVSSIGPAFARSGPRLAGEAQTGIFPYRGILAAFLLESFLLFVVMVVPRQIDRLRPYAAPKLSPDEVIYYSADELPRTDDLGGAQSAASGHGGGQQAHHRTQTIRVARGSSLAPQVVDAPNLNLPSSTAAVANLLAFKSNPGPPPTEGLHSSLVAPNLPANVIAPAPVNVTRDQSRNGVALNSIVPPAPNISAAASRNAPALNSAVVPPAPSVRSEHRLVAPPLNTSIIAPAPNLLRERTLAAPALNANVIPPAPASLGREVSPSRVLMNNVAVVPPPVSSPERESARNSKLSLPAPSVVAPPPSADSARDLRRLESGSMRSSGPNIVPPPPTQAANGSFVSSIIGKLFGTQDVVPPPPTLASGTRGPANGGLAANIVPPPPSASGVAPTAGSGVSRRSSLGANIVPPPPSVTGSDTSSAVGSGTSRRASLGTSVVPPPPSVGLGSSGEGNRIRSATGIENPLASNVVPPPPSVGTGSGPSGSGRKGIGLGGPGDAGSVLAPPKGAGGTRDTSGVVVSAQPGSNVGMPGTGGKGSLAMSPSGSEKPGIGGSGGGAGMVRGEGPGSSLTGEGAGAGKPGTGHAADLNSRGGISPTPGPGGAGSAPTGSSTVPGVDVRGGSTIVTLPSFGSDAGSREPNLPGRTSMKAQQGPSITIVATSRSGGAFDFYGKLPGDNYTVYVDTTIGTVVMQFAEVDPAAVPAHAGALTGPQGLRTNLPADLPHARIVIKAKLDASGNLRNLQVLEPGPAAMTAKIMAALPGWKFRPAMRGEQPVEVNAILGFNIDTNDRN
ncbi:MAG: energy transducer TonB [Candidatus Sulfotelmatobacter sp.]